MEDGSGVEGGVDGHALEEEGVGFAVKIVAPMDGGVGGGEDGMLPTVEDAVAGVEFVVALGEEFFLGLEEALNLF